MQHRDSKIFIAHSGNTSHMVNLKGNMKNLKDTEIRVTIGDSRTLAITKHGDWHGYQILDRNLHRMTLTNTDAIPGIHTNVFSVTRLLQKGFQVKSEGETLLLNKHSTNIFLMRKWQTNPAKDFY